jgi:hypothetical protein
MNQNIEGMFKKLLKGRGEAQASQGFSFGSDSYTDWQKLVIIFVIINILVLIWSGYLFWQINQGNIFEVAPAPGAGADKSTLVNLNNTITTYDAREKHFEDLRVAPPSAADPAL